MIKKYLFFVLMFCTSSLLFAQEVDTEALASFQLDQAVKELESGRLKKAMKWAEKSRETDPQSPGVYYVMGDIERFRGNYEKALAWFVQSKALFNTYALTHFKMGLCHAAMEQPDAAMEAYSMALHLDSALTDARMARVSLYISKGENEKALGDLDTLLMYDPAAYKNYRVRGLLRYEAGRFKEAESDFEKYLSVYPGDAEALYYRGLARIYAGYVYEGCGDLLNAEKMNFPQARAKRKELCTY